MTDLPSKLELRGGRIEVSATDARSIVMDVFERLGCPEEHSVAITDHLIDANLCGVVAHATAAKISCGLPPGRPHD